MKEPLTEQGSGEALDNHWTWKDTTSQFDFFFSPSISIYSCLRVQTDFNKCICCHQQLLSAASFIFIGLFSSHNVNQSFQFYVSNQVYL